SLSFEGKEVGREELVNKMMELYAPDVVAEVPPHDDEQIGPVLLRGSANVQKWVDKISRTQVKLLYIQRRQTKKQFEGTKLVFVCAFLSAAKIATFGHSTVHPVGLTLSKPGVQPGYLIFGAPDGHAYTIDVKGNVAKKWSAPEPGSELQYARPLASGNLLAQVRSAKSVVGAAGADGVIEITQDDRTVWKYTDNTRFRPHEMERRSNGNSLLVCSKDLDVPQISRK